MTIAQIYKQAKHLTSLEKARRSDLLLGDLDHEDPSICAAWVKEAKARKAAITSGTSKTLTYHAVIGKY